MTQNKTPAMVLQELCVKQHFPSPNYEILDATTGTHISRFEYQVTVCGVTGIGTGSSKQISKHEAALHLLEQLKDLGIYDPKELPVQEFKPITNHDNVNPVTVQSSSNTFKSSPNAIGPLKDLCFEHKISDPVFTMLSEVGPPHSKKFTFECQVQSLKTVCTSSTKKLAKQYAAQEMLEKVKSILPEVAAACMATQEELTAITHPDDEALKRYNQTYGSIITDKTCKVGDYPFTLKKRMDEFGKTYEDFSQDMCLRNVDALKRILNQIEVDFEFLVMQEEDPFIAALILKIDTPFTTIGLGNNVESAKNSALDQAFDVMTCFMRATY